MQSLDNILYGFGIALSPINLLYCWVGALLGTIVGVLPGMNPLIAIAMLLPLTFKMPAVAAIIMLAGIYYGAHHSCSTTAIMLNMPPEPVAIVICFDGYPMALQGRAGPALSIAAIGSFLAGCACIPIIAFFSPLLAEVALNFQAPEYTVVCVLALVGASVITTRSTVSTLAMAVLGLILGTVGTDITSGVTRFTFGEQRLAEGIDFIPVAAGLFAFVEMVSRLGSKRPQPKVEAKLRDVVPRWEDFRASFMPIVRGTAIGAAFGTLPGTGPLIASYCSYAVEKKIARDPSRFGKGAIEGVAGPEAANNAAAFTHFIPMLTLGVPAGATFALLLGALLIQGIQPGPQIISTHPDLFWGLIASMWIGNFMLLILNLPLVSIWIKLLQTPYRFIYPMILLFSCIGCYSVRSQPFDVLIAAVVLLVGYVLEKLDCGPGPLIIGMVLGPILEENLRRAMFISRGDPSIFITRPISASILILTALLLVIFALPSFGRRRAPVSSS